MGLIKTKFNVEDEVWCIEKNIITPGKIKKIFVESTFEGDSIVYAINTNTKCNNFKRAENDIYKTIDDLVQQCTKLPKIEE